MLLAPTEKQQLLHLLFNLFKSLRLLKLVYLSTVQNKINNTVIPSTHTTPDALALNELLSHVMVEQGCEYAFMEVSSHAVVQHRITGLQFVQVLYLVISLTIILDYHKTFDEYIKAKKGFSSMQLPIQTHLL